MLLTQLALKQDHDHIVYIVGDQSLEYQECEIIEEIFTPDIQQMEQVRLEAIYRTRSLLRDAAPPQVRNSQEISL